MNRGTVPDISVVVPTYNQSALLAECLRSLADQTLARDRYEVIVVDDGSTDATPEVIRDAGAHARGVRLLANRGRSAARNAGVDQARAELIVFIDSDIVVRPDFLTRHLETHERHSARILSRGPVIQIPDVEAASRTPVPRLAASPAYLDTANAGVRRATIRQAGMFDEEFPGYGWEDFELGIRLRRLGVRRVFAPEAVAFHVQPPMNSHAFSNLLRKEEARARSAVYFYRKVPGLETRLLIQATLLHRLLYWTLSAGGLLTPERAPRFADRLQRSGLSTLAFLALRGVLNRHYIQSLYGEFRRNAAVLA